MTDVHTPEQRSFNMSRIRHKNTNPELVVRKFLHSKGYRYRLNVSNLIGKPDIVMKKYNAVIFVNGCFWHGHKNCSFYKEPKTNTEWWRNKIQKNIIRDRTNIVKLREIGWNVMTIWECELRINSEYTLNDLIQNLEL